MDRISAFISYSSEEKAIAAKFKYNFEKYCGFQVFLAHDGTQPSSEWEREIVNAIKISDYFIPLISEHFKSSDYTNQEIGMAMALEKVCIPVKIASTNPYGFISKYHAFQYKKFTDRSSRDNNIDQLVIQTALLGQKYGGKLEVKTLNSVMYALEHSSSYDISNIVMKIICLMNHLQPTHIESILHAISSNGQVSDAFELNRLIILLNSKYSVKVDQKY